ncbi:DUF6055 domain-containing protein [Thermovenabulum gondwanense]|uniref:Uncharacterized protein n=1 Tax=Thermovenabulum gondwanense TaxID=520767 RepID=A0A162MP36_9FIRM|nr:DUF6055 domain-containing protein [Thermovenabulum gondwanense]KYO66840.1 hypothetical protein ATZ99_08940 [Thermovenabulum gondwanense]
MKLFYKKLFAFILIVIFIFTALVIPGCSFGNKQNVEKDNKSLLSGISISEPKPIYNLKNEISKELKGIDKELSDLFSAPDDYEELPPNSTELIEKALNEGKINKEKAAVYKIFSNYDPERLPAEYRSNEPVDTAQYDIRYLIDNWESLSEETRNQVTPYLIPLDDPHSFFYPGNKKQNKNSVSGLKIFNEALAAEEDYKVNVEEFTHDGQKFKILYYEEKNWAAEKKQSLKATVSYIKESIIYSWDKFRPLMGIKPSKPFIIELVKFAERLYGLEWYEDGNYRIRINILYANNEKLNKSTIAHELFHAFQDEMKIGYNTIDEKWLCEATAVWAENYVYPDYNLEHAWHPRFFRTLDKARIGSGKGFEYLSYMFFYYLTDYARVNFIREIIKTAGQSGSKSIRPFLEKNTPKLKETYATFALYNWNWPPVDKYYDNGKITGGPSGKCFKKKIMKVDEEDEVSVSLNPGALMYYLYIFDQKDPTLQHVTITFEKSIADDKYLKRQAILRINGNWVVEDWSSETVKQYCKAKTDKNEDIQALVLIYSNANLKDELKEADKFRVETGKCYKEMQLNLTFEYNYSVPGFEWKSKGNLIENLEIKDHCYYVVKSSSYNFGGEGFIDGKKVVETSGSASFAINNPDIYNSLVRILKKPSDNTEELKDAYEKYGIKENIPPQGILITVPALLEGVVFKGYTVFSFPEPIGTINLSEPLPLDGISQVIAVTPDLNDWNAKGINMSMEVDVFNHKCPIQGAFTVDFNKMAEQLDNIGNVPGIGNGIKLPDSQEMKDALSFLKENNMENLFNLGNQGGAKELSSLNAINAIKNAMIPGKIPSKGSAKLRITVDGVYKKYHGE